MSSRFAQRRKQQPFRYNIVSLLVLLGLVLLFAHLSYNMAQRLREVSGKRNAAAAELAEITEMSNGLQQELKALQTEAGQEAEIRERYSVAKPNEGVIVIVDSQEQETIPEESAEEKKWWDIF